MTWSAAGVVRNVVYNRLVTRYIFFAVDPDQKAKNVIPIPKLRTFVFPDPLLESLIPLIFLACVQAIIFLLS